MDLLDKMIDDPQDYDMKLAVPIFFVSHVWCRPSKSLHLSHPDDVQGSKAQALLVPAGEHRAAAEREPPHALQCTSSDGNRPALRGLSPLWSCGRLECGCCA